MKPERWPEVERLYLAALEREAGQRAAFLDEVCAGDLALRREVESLLAYQEQAEHFIEAPALEVAAKALAGEQASSVVGRLIGHYRVLSLLGVGGMGEVYLAEDLRLGRRVALKLLPAEFTTDPNRVRRFEQEARAASALNHPNIITIHEIGRVGDLHFIATEYVDGQTLRQRMRGAPLKLGEVLEIAIQAAGALAAAHKAGIVHRDIKPENIMRRRDGYIKVLDFGIAKLSERPVAAGRDRFWRERSETAPGRVLGTLAYMSPEQARGLKVDSRSDLFSLGIVLYELIAGRAPFAGATSADVVVAILEKEPPPLAQAVPAVPPQLEGIVRKALQKDREARYQQANDLLSDLQRLKQRLEFEAELAGATRPRVDTDAVTWTSGGPAQAKVATGRPRATKTWLVSATAGILLTGSAVAAYHYRSSWRASPPPNPRTAPAPARVEVLRYYLETTSAAGGKAFATGFEPLAADQEFRFHFTPRARGFLYIVGPDDQRNVPTTFLTAQPSRDSGVTTNEVAAGVDYTFPAGEDKTLEITGGTHINTFTIILSAAPLAKPSFLAAPAGRRLTLSEQQELESLRKQFGVNLAESAAGAGNGLSGVTIMVPAERASGDPLVFDIPVKRK